MNFLYLFGWLLGALYFSPAGIAEASEQTMNASLTFEEKVQRMAEGQRLLEEIDRHIVNGEMDSALRVLDKATAPDLDVGAQKPLADRRKRMIFYIQGRHKEAKEIAENIYRSRQFDIADLNRVPYEIEIRMYEAFISGDESGHPIPIYQLIQQVREENKNALPPNAFTGDTPWRSGEIIRLYDHIADYDAGISFIDGIVDYLYQKHTPLLKRWSVQKPSGSHEARAVGKEKGIRVFRQISEYLKIREAFEQDKREGRPSCVGARKPCVGRATKALIESDYFPW